MAGVPSAALCFIVDVLLMSKYLKTQKRPQQAKTVLPCFYLRYSGSRDYLIFTKF